MKNGMEDVRNHLVAMLEALGDNEATPETVERAKATAQVAGTYISAVKCEMDALRLYDETGKIPRSIIVDETPKLRAIGGR